MIPLGCLAILDVLAGMSDMGQSLTRDAYINGNQNPNFARKKRLGRTL